jgi:rfaE bifunctional protein nucleotidyltransferase chain/domain
MGHHKRISDVICSWENLEQRVAHWKLNGEKIVFTNGCFDLLHKGHIDYLNKAADLGDRLVVGLNSDESVSRLKGEHRPLQDESSRSFVMASLECVSAVTVFTQDTPKELIERVRPDVLVKGGDYIPETVVGADFVVANGGKVEIIPFLEGYSTTSIEKKIIASNN